MGRQPVCLDLFVSSHPQSRSRYCLWLTRTRREKEIVSSWENIGDEVFCVTSVPVCDAWGGCI